MKEPVAMLAHNKTWRRYTLNLPQRFPEIQKNLENCKEIVRDEAYF